MSENFYIKLPFYLSRSSIPSTVEIKIDGEVVGTIEVTATDRSNMNVLTYPLTKSAATFALTLKSSVIDLDEAGNYLDHCVCLDDIWISLNGTDFRSLLLNSSLVDFTQVPNDEVFGFNPGIGACLFSDSMMSFTIPVPDPDTFDNIYKIRGSNDFGYDDETKLQDFYGAEWENAKILIQKAKDLFAARGY